MMARGYNIIGNQYQDAGCVVFVPPQHGHGQVHLEHWKHNNVRILHEMLDAFGFLRWLFSCIALGFAVYTASSAVTTDIKLPGALLIAFVGSPYYFH